MSGKTVKKHPTLGCCGLDCGLCPRYYTEGSSQCPGCCGPDFYSKNPGCGFITCCVKKNNLEVCGECNDYPCQRFNDWLKKKAYDSFLTHKKIDPNQDFIKKHGLQVYIEQQSKRIHLLEEMLKDFNDGRSKSFYCISTTLLSIEALEKIIRDSKKKIKLSNVKDDDFKTKATILKDFLKKAAEKEHIKLKLNKPPHWK